MAKWALELSKFDMRFHPRPLIKAQVLADFILKCTILREDKKQDEGTSSPVDPKDQWTLHVDGSSSSSESGTRLILALPEGEVAEYDLHFDFSTTNNEVEYEALLAKIIKELGVEHLIIFNNSQLVVGQVKGEYKTREENMKKYLAMAKILAKSFQSFNI